MIPAVFPPGIIRPRQASPFFGVFRQTELDFASFNIITANKKTVVSRGFSASGYSSAAPASSHSSIVQRFRSG